MVSSRNCVFKGISNNFSLFQFLDHITVTVGDDSADSEDTSHWSDCDNSSDVVIIEDSDSELSENGLPTDSVSTYQPSFQGRADNHQQLSQMPPGNYVKYPPV